MRPSFFQSNDSLYQIIKSLNYSTIQTFSIVFPSLVLVKCKIDKIAAIA